MLYRKLNVSKLNYKSAHVITGLLLFALIIAPMLSLVSTQLAFAQPTTVLTPKWTRSGVGTNWEGGLVIGDVTGDGQEDIVYAGCSNDMVYVLDGDDGRTIATYSNSRIGGSPGSYSQPQLYDVDGDGVLDILVPLFYMPGLAAVQYDGDSTLRQMWVANTQGSSGSGSVMAKPVAGDIDGDGNLDIFLASQDVSPIGGYDGTIVRIDHQGRIVAQSFSWRACSGGLSLADTDNDGVFEVYQGDRQMGYSDGGYGKGVKSFWAENLTERWVRLDFLSSSQAPVLVDVTGDGVLDVLAGMYREMNVLNSTNGERISRISSGTLSVHYGFTVYDIDGDGRLELLCSDGDNDDDPYVDVYDLVTGVRERQLSLAGGDSKWSPVVADIDPSHAGMEIIAVPNGTSLDGGGSSNAAIMIWSSDYESLQTVTRSSTGSRLGAQLAYPIIQDIDDDGLLELVTHSSGGVIYAFDTNAPAPGYSSSLPGSHRIRSEVTYFGEKRTGAAISEPAPWAPNYWTAPLVAPISPGDNGLAVPVSTSQLSFKVREHQSQPLTYSVITSPNIGSRSGSVSSTYDWTTITVPVSGLAYDTTYRWTITVNDGSEVTRRTYTFRTEQAPNIGNSAPSQGTPLLNPVNGVNPTSTFECSNQSTVDANGDAVTNIYRWTVNGDPVAQLLLPFDTRSETSTADYSGFNNDGVVRGATWVPNGRVGGAYLFDGKDDAIVISDGGAGYFNGRSYTSNNEELGGFGNWNGVTVEAWVYLTENNYGSRIIGKIPSYSLGFASGSTNRLYASVWPYTGEISDDANQATVDRERSVSYSQSLQLNRWYHIAFTYQSGVGLRLYLNGALVSQSSAYTGPLSNSRGEPLYIGRLVEPFAGMIDEVRLYSYPLSAGQISNRYQESRYGDSSRSLFIPSGIGTIGDVLACQVIPTDSWDEGTALTSQALFIGSTSQQYTLTVNVVGGGTVTKNPNQDSYSYGTSVSLTAVPATGYTFAGWSSDASGTGLTTVVNMTSNKVVTATFVSQNNLTISVIGEGTTNPAPATYTYTQGSQITVDAIPQAGFRLSHWLLNGQNVGSIDPYTFTVNSNTNLTAVFIPIQHQLHVEVKGLGNTNATGETLYNAGTTVSVLATADSGWAFNYWLVNGTNVGNVNPHTMTMDANYNLTAVFTQVQYQLRIQVSGQGTTNDTGDAQYYYGENVVIQANPSAGWSFSHWLLNGTEAGSTNPYVLLMNANYDLTAVFIPISDQLMDVSVNTNRDRYSKWSYVDITVDVKDNTSEMPLQNAPVDITVYDTHGRVAWTATGTTGVDGIARFTYKLVFNAQMGTYTVSATVALSGYTTETDQITFYSLG